MAKTVSEIVIFLGPPGVGKGTQAKILADKIGFEHISTGDLIRQEKADQTEIGLLMQEMGWSKPDELDELVLVGLQNRLDHTPRKNILLDGCPRSEKQMHGLHDMLKSSDYQIKCVIEFTGNERQLIDRISGRYSCTQCQAIYHDQNKPTFAANCCDVCASSNFYWRPEDTDDVILRRLENYQNITLPLTEHYKSLGLLKQIDGMAGVNEVTAALLHLI